MKTFPTSFLSVLTGFAGMYSPAVGDDLALPSLRLLPESLGLYVVEPEDSAPCDDWEMSVGCALVNTSPWRLAWCEGDKAVITMQDSSGGRGKAIVSTWDLNVLEIHKTGSLSLDADHWRPGAESQWVRVKGEVPFAVSLQDAESEPVTIKLARATAVPIVLKGAGLAGADGRFEDVKATLGVKDCGGLAYGGEKRLELELSANRPLGVRAFEFQLADGSWSDFGESVYEGHGKGSYRWSRYLDRNDLEAKVRVRYALHPGRVMAEVDARVALSGFTGGDEELKRLPVVQKGDAVTVNASAGPVAGGEGIVTAKLESLNLLSKDEDSEEPLKLEFWMNLEAWKDFKFGRVSTGKQKLEVTDSTGRGLNPAVFDLSCLSFFQFEITDVLFNLIVHADCNIRDALALALEPPYASIGGVSAGLASPGAEWVRLRGTLHVPMGKKKASPVYELPLVQGAETFIPVPGLEKAGNGRSAPTCLLWLEEVERPADPNQEMRVKVYLAVGGVPFDLADFELVDGKGFPLPVSSSPDPKTFTCGMAAEFFKNDFVDGVESDDGNGREWARTFGIPNDSAMKQLRVRVKYWSEMKTVAVPVDVRVGLGGLIPGRPGAKRS